MKEVPPPKEEKPKPDPEGAVGGQPAEEEQNASTKPELPLAAARISSSSSPESGLGEEPSASITSGTETTGASSEVASPPKSSKWKFFGYFSSKSPKKKDVESKNATPSNKKSIFKNFFGGKSPSKPQPMDAGEASTSTGVSKGGKATKGPSTVFIRKSSDTQNLVSASESIEEPTVVKRPVDPPPDPPVLTEEDLKNRPQWVDSHLSLNLDPSEPFTETTDAPTASESQFTAHWSQMRSESVQSQSEEVAANPERRGTLEEVPDIVKDESVKSPEHCSRLTEDELKNDEECADIMKRDPKVDKKDCEK